MARKLQLRRGTAAQWTTANPILAQGEPGFEVDTLRMKLGDGSTAWTSLAYVGGAGNAISAISALTPAAGKMIYFTSGSAAAQVDSTSYGRALLNVADEAALKALINAEGGVDFATPSSVTTGLARAMPVGSVLPYAGPVAPSGWLFCFGQSLNRVDYSALYDAICTNIGTATITIASPAVITVTGHGLTIYDRVRIFTTGALPTGLAVETDYYVSAVIDANQFRVSATPGGANVNTSGGQSGTHNVRRFPHAAASSTTFNVPDMRGRVVAGRDNMGGTSANRLATVLDGDVLGNTGGSETHTLTTAELAVHSHANTLNDPGHAHQQVIYNTTETRQSGGASGNLWRDTALASTTAAFTGMSINNANAGSGSAHNNVQPTIILNYIIFTDV